MRRAEKRVSLLRHVPQGLCARFCLPLIPMLPPVLTFFRAPLHTRTPAGCNGRAHCAMQDQPANFVPAHGTGLQRALHHKFAGRMPWNAPDKDVYDTGARLLLRKLRAIFPQGEKHKAGIVSKWIKEQNVAIKRDVDKYVERQPKSFNEFINGKAKAVSRELLHCVQAYVDAHEDRSGRCAARHRAAPSKNSCRYQHGMIQFHMPMHMQYQQATLHYIRT